MKYSLIVSSLFASLLLCSGCSTTGTQTQTPATVAASVCPALEAGLSTLQALNLSATASADLAKVVPAVDAVCASVATVNATNLQTLVNTAVPAIISVIKVSPLSTTDQNNSIAGITAIELIVDTYLAVEGAPAIAPPLVTSDHVVPFTVTLKH